MNDLEEQLAAYEQELAELRRLAFEDELTGLGNRRAFERELERCMSEFDRYGGELSVVYIDLDGFKAVNDRHGHAAGDRVLASVGRMLKGAVRTCDVSVRLGGDEFAILLPRTSAREAFDVAERLRDRLARLLTPVPVTASFGVAGLNGSGGAPGAADLLRRADAAMYAAKSLGKNRVCKEQDRAA